MHLNVPLVDLVLLSDVTDLSVSRSLVWSTDRGVSSSLKELASGSSFSDVTGGDVLYFGEIAGDCLDVSCADSLADVSVVGGVRDITVYFCCVSCMFYFLDWNYTICL